MPHDPQHPWFPEALELLAPRRRDRVLLITAAHPRYVQALVRCVGGEGEVLTIEPDRRCAAAVVAAVPDIEVIGVEPTGEEDFGRFDALLACPLTTPRWPLPAWSGIAARNLRPGGRFAIDLPGEILCEDLAACWLEVGGSPDRLTPLQGPAEQDLARSLRDRGLRTVTAAMGTHLVRLDSARALARLGANLLGVGSDREEELGIALTRRLRTAGSVEVVFHRTRVHGMR